MAEQLRFPEKPQGPIFDKMIDDLAFSMKRLDISSAEASRLVDKFQNYLFKDHFR